MGFIRVRSAKGPRAVYEVSESAIKARPNAFERVEGDSKSESKVTPVAKTAARAARKETSK